MLLNAGLLEELVQRTGVPETCGLNYFSENNERMQTAVGVIFCTEDFSLRANSSLCKNLSVCWKGAPVKGRSRVCWDREPVGHA